MAYFPVIPFPQTEIGEAGEHDKLEKLCLDFDEDCVIHRRPPFGSFRKCWDYDRSSGFCPFCLPRD